MDYANLTDQAAWLYKGIDGELNEVGPDKMNDTINACSMTAGHYALMLSGVLWKSQSAGKDIPNRDVIFEPKTFADMECAALCGVDCFRC